jgi:hypothetical protein
MSTFLISRRRALVCLYALVFAQLAAAQDRTGAQPEVAGRASEKIARTDWRPSPMALARNVLQQYEFVGVGEFLYDASPASSELNSRTLILTFQVDTTYKKPDLPAIEVELNSDMLIATGEQVSRYAKRQKVWKEFSGQGERSNNALHGLENSLKAGRLTQAEYDRRKNDLEIAERERHKQVASPSNRMIAVMDAKSFYDRGGAIRPGEKYLLAVNRTRDRVNIYELSDHDLNIFWDREREEITAALEKLAQ